MDKYNPHRNEPDDELPSFPIHSEEVAVEYEAGAIFDPLGALNAILGDDMLDATTPVSGLASAPDISVHITSDYGNIDSVANQDEHADSVMGLGSALASDAAVITANFVDEESICSKDLAFDLHTVEKIAETEIIVDECSDELADLPAAEESCAAANTSSVHYEHPVSSVALEESFLTGLDSKSRYPQGAVVPSVEMQEDRHNDALANTAVARGWGFSCHETPFSYPPQLLYVNIHFSDAAGL